MKMHHCQTEEETIALAQRMARTLTGVVTLNGTLGAGKSTFARAVIQSLTSAEEDVPSPTFTLVQNYEARDSETSHRQIYHLDLYRLEDAEEIFELGWDDMQVENSLIMIEWAERIEDLLPRKRTDIMIEIMNTHSRTITVKEHIT